MSEAYKQQVTHFFDQRTAYDAEGKSHPAEAKRLLENSPLISGQTVLDLATGTGLVAIPAAHAVSPGLVMGVDLSAGMLNQARAKRRRQRLENLDLIEADIETIHFNPEQFDVIFCCSALIYICDIPALLRKCHSWLKVGGYFAFTTPSRYSYQAELKVRVCQDVLGIDLPHILRPLWTEHKCRDLLQDAEFQDINVTTHLYNRQPIDPNQLSRLEQDFYPWGNPLLELSDVQLTALHRAYQKVIIDKVAQHGPMQENYNFLVTAKKSTML